MEKVPPPPSPASNLSPTSPAKPSPGHGGGRATRRQRFSPAPGLPASQPSIAHHRSFPNFCFPNFSFCISLPLTTLLPSKCPSTGALPDPSRYPGIPANAPVSWNAVALHRFSPPRPAPPTTIPAHPLQIHPADNFFMAVGSAVPCAPRLRQSQTME